MKLRFEWSPWESAPGRAAVLALQGIPAAREVPLSVAELLGQAVEEYLQVAAPRAVLAEVSGDEFTRIHRGAGRNAPASPLQRIAARAERLALYAATVGEGVTGRIADLFGHGDPALGCALDSVASAAADRLSELLRARYRCLIGCGAERAPGVLPYSPGYCGWHVSGQFALFQALAPGEIGITLNASGLMQPLKSVSGVLVAGPSRIHRFAPDYPFCVPCADRPCRERIASVLAE